MLHPYSFGFYLLEMKFLLTCSILLYNLKIHVDCQKDPSIVRITKFQVKNTGDNAELICNLRNLGDYPVFWYQLRNQNVPHILTMGEKRQTGDPRFSARFNYDKTAYTLVIGGVKYEDASNYMCQIGTPTPITRTVQLRVPTPPSIGDDVSKDVVVSEGASLELRCNATGDPLPTISWKRADTNPLPNGLSEYTGPVFTINSVQKSDRGRYLCVASNDVGSGDKKLVTVNVEFAPFLDGSKIRVGQLPNYHLNAVLECFVESFPAPDVWWTRGTDSDQDAPRIKNNHNYRVDIIHDSSGHDLTTSRLTVIEVQNEDLGSYQCRASNVRGKSSLTFTLFESSVALNHYGGYQNNEEAYQMISTSSAHSPVYKFVGLTKLATLTIVSLLSTLLSLIQLTSF